MFQALVLGLIVGAIFGTFGLSVPAPANAAGVAGIIGLTLGYALVK